MIAEKGLEAAAKDYPVIYSGINTYAGCLTCKNVADSLNIEFKDILGII